MVGLQKADDAGVYRVSDDLALYRPGTIEQFDAIVMNNSNGPWIRPTPDDMPKFQEYGADVSAVEKVLRHSLLNYVSKGGGIVAYHHAIGGNTQWPEFQELIGAGYWGHPWNEKVGIKLDDPDHPLMATFQGKGFRLASFMNEARLRPSMRVITR